MSKNDITGDKLISKGYSEQGRANHGLIFGPKQTIFYWPEGTWCDVENYPLYTHATGQVTQIEVPKSWGDHQIEVHVRSLCSPG